MTEPSTTAAPSPEEAVRQAMTDYFAAYDACGMKPQECDPTAFTAAGSEAQLNLQQFVRDATARGIYFSSDHRGSYDVIEKIVVADSIATVFACKYDAGIVLGPEGPDGRPTVVNDEIQSVRNEYNFGLDAGQWWLTRAARLEELGGEDKCGGSSH